jgi:chromosome segregation ATPase
LAKYGFKFGISSRGTGDTYEDYNGEETVDADTYDFQAFDLVLLPACEDARLKLAESLDTRKMKLSKALNEALDNANEDERKIMKETLDNLDIDYTPENEVIEEANASTTAPEKDDNIEVQETPLAADDNGADVMKELQESLKTQKELEKQIKSLQEQLSVCYTKEARYSNVLGRTKNELAQAKSTNARLSKTVETLNESLSQSKEAENRQSRKIAMLEEKLATMRSGNKSLTESVSTSQSEITTLKEQLTSAKESSEKKVKLLNEKHLRETRELEAQNAQLQESIADLKKDNQISKGQYSAKLSKAQSLVEKYKAVAQTAVEKYIKLQATRLGISADEVKRKLNENYSFNDIDRVCEELQKYKLTVNSLPFDMRRPSQNKPVKMTIKESVETIKPINDDGFDIDDDMDTSFLNIN